MTKETGQGFAAMADLLRGGARLVAVFGSVDDLCRPIIHYIVDSGDYATFSGPVDVPIPSLTRITPAAGWHERELHEVYGVVLDGHPDLRPLMVHNIPRNAPADGLHGTQTDGLPYRFLEVSGVGVCEVPVGPVHAGIIEPGHFRFSVVGDRVIHLELRHFYTHKGTEKLFEGTFVERGIPIAESVSGDNCFAHAVAYCQAVEHALEIAVPPRAEGIRAVGLELERMLAHAGDFGALCGDVGFNVAAAQGSGLKEILLQASAECVGTRYWRGIGAIGGVRRDISAAGARKFAETVSAVHREFAELAHDALETPSVQDRFENTGILRQQVARDFGTVGLVARASGISADVRRDHPYGAYCGLNIDVPLYHDGDVLARARVRVDETKNSARLIAALLESLPQGPISSSKVDYSRDRKSFSAVESPRGELLYWIETRDARIARCHIRSPSFQNWPALPQAVIGNIIADFPLINKSFNLSYSGCDR